jgi:hypothetical protein
VIDARGSAGVVVGFGAGDGHDIILSDRELGDDNTFGNGPLGDGIAIIDMTSLSKADVTIIWNPTYLIEDNPPSGNPTDIPGSLLRQGDLVIRIDATGDTILIHGIRGSTTYWSDPSEASSPPFDGPFDFVDLHEITEVVQFTDGRIDASDTAFADLLV